jgi:hypothetical protein
MDFMEIAQNLTEADRATYIALTRLFESDGWTILNQMLEENRDAATQRKLHANDWIENRIEHGKIFALDVMINFPDSFENLYSHQAEENLELQTLTAENDPL